MVKSKQRLDMNSHPCIAFEGPIAAGKTTHAKLLADRLGVEPLLEDFPGNEFLGDFYADKRRWALPMQLSFVVMRHAQLRTVSLPLAQPVVIDYSHLKDSTFAQVLLEARELRLYHEISQPFHANVVKPDLVVYLDARNDVLLQRIRQRNRSYEMNIDSVYEQVVRDAYEKSFAARSDLTVIRYDTSDLDLNSPSDVQRLQDKILSAFEPTLNLAPVVNP